MHKIKMIELRNIKKSYKLSKVKVDVLKGISLKIEKGEFVAIMGPSGSGKTTLMNILGCLDKPDSGEYLLDGVNVRKMNDNQLADIRNKKIGFIFQNFNLLPNINVYKNVELPLIYGGNFLGRQRIKKILESLDVDNFLYHKPNELSGGQQQRVAIARALVNEPEIILADEPTGNLDFERGKEIMCILSELNKKGKTIVMVTHDSDIAGYAKRIIHVADGEIIADYLKKNRNTEEKDNREKAEINSDLSKHSLLQNIIIFFLKIYETFRIVFSSLFTHKIRSFLTLLGIIIGVSSVTTVFSIGKGARQYALEVLRQAHPNLVILRTKQKEKGFTTKDLDIVKSLWPDIVNLVPVSNYMGGIKYKNKEWRTIVTGTGKDYFEISKRDIIKGERFSEEDFNRADKVAVIGMKVAKELFNAEEPIGEFISIKGVKVKVIGVLKEIPSLPNIDLNNVVIVPLSTCQKRIFGKESYFFREIYILAKEVLDIPVLMDRLKNGLKYLYNLSDNKFEEKYEILSQENIIEFRDESSEIFATLLFLIGSISLLLGGCNIWG
ncbi:MAG: ATP-binding cassette domain-containing protein, partial [Candidatus Omnitrophica bacterium]|nr:ATP-binding cassette domain-containing protein [Candidatus Omnitrophota bacterium]